MNKLKFLTIAVMSTVFLTTTSINAMNQDNNDKNNNIYNNINNSNINNSSEILNNESKLSKDEKFITDKNYEILKEMNEKFEWLILQLKPYIQKIIPIYICIDYEYINGEFKPIYKTRKLDTKSIIEENINNTFKYNNNFLEQIKTNFENAYNEYKDKYSKTLNNSEKENIKKEYIEKCKEEINKIRSYVTTKFMEGSNLHDFYADDITNITSDHYEDYTFNGIEKLVKELKKNKETYEKFYEEQKDMGKITNKIQKQIIKNFKKVVQELNKKDKDLILLNHNVYTLNYLIKELRKVQDNKDEKDEILPPSEQLLHNKDKELTKELEKDVEKLVAENNKIINGSNDISNEDILNYYNKIINLGEKIQTYAIVISEKVSQENYKSNFYLYKTSWMNKRIEENLKKILDDDIFSSIPKETWK